MLAGVIFVSNTADDTITTAICSSLCCSPWSSRSLSGVHLIILGDHVSPDRPRSSWGRVGLLLWLTWTPRCDAKKS